ncbi:hypothetical protein [Crenothrix sp.]|uniref:hypothetical protein n=1 Tax=Crenothrix sp. TaxID=3100433 RepID=UPI00374CE93E
MKNHEDKFSGLRQRAEKLLNPSEITLPEILEVSEISDSIAEIRDTIHELYTYRIELELQNDELLSAQKQLQDISQEYLDFYNDSPVAYVTLSNDNRILKANNTLAIYLDAAKQNLVKHLFTDYVLADDQDILYLYRQALTDNKHPPACEFRLRKKNAQPFWVRCEGFFKSKKSRQEINLVLTDINECKQAELGLQELLSHQKTGRKQEITQLAHEIHEELTDILAALKTDLKDLSNELPVDLSACHEKCTLMDKHIDMAIQTVENHGTKRAL